MESGKLSRSQSKVIFHMDGDSFFVACEVAKDQKLKGLPLVTGADRGIVTAASYEAKALGVTRGMPIFQLKRKFPQVIIRHGDYRMYAEYSSKMFDIVRRYADDLEEYSIDECFADLTGLNKTLKISYGEIITRIKKEVNEELKLSVSVGIASTKVLAKVASKWQKPNGLTIIDRSSIEEFLKKTPIGKIWGIGWRTDLLLQKKGIETAYDFTMKDREWVYDSLAKPYRIIWEELRGNSILQVDPRPKTEYSSIQKTRSFHPVTNDISLLLSKFSKNVEEACAKARHYDLTPKEVSFFLKTKDFTYSNLSIELPIPTNAPEIILSLLKENFKKIYSTKLKYRTTGVVLRNLTQFLSRQGQLFEDDDKAKKFEIIHKQIDLLENKMGKKSVYLASTHKAFKNSEEGTDMDDLDRDLLFL